MKKIILHWTAGSYTPSTLEKAAYHYLIDNKGAVFSGIYKPEANFCNLSAMPVNYCYARHTGGGNSYAIGVSLCGMCGYNSKNPESTKYPLTKIQLESAFKFCASLAEKYSINPSPESILTHYEFGLSHPKTTSAGKIDINFLSPYPSIPKEKVGDFIRDKIAFYLKKSS